MRQRNRSRALTDQLLMLARVEVADGAQYAGAKVEPRASVTDTTRSSCSDATSIGSRRSPTP